MWSPASPPEQPQDGNGALGHSPAAQSGSLVGSDTDSSHCSRPTSAPRTSTTRTRG
jgi:hypothetical protein